MPYKDKDAYNEYLRKYMLERWHVRREKAVEQLGGKCVNCGATDNLDFDHIDPSTKSFTIGSRPSASEDKFQAELAKCQLLCRQCHMKKHRIDIDSSHGTSTMWTHYSCKCDICRIARNEYSRERKSLRKNI